MLGHRERVLTMARHAQVKRLKPLQEEERCKGAHGRAGVAEPMRAHVDHVGDVAHRLEVIREDGSMVARRGPAELGPFLALRRPLEVPAVDDRAADVRAVPTDEFRRGVDDDIHPVIDRAQKQRRHHRIVADERDRAVRCGVGSVGDRLDIRDVVLGVAERLHVDEARVLVDEPMDGLGLARVEEADLDAEVFEGLREERVRAAVEARARDEVLPAMADRENRSRDGALTAREAEPRDATVERGQALLEDIHRGVHDPGVDVSEFGQPEE